MLGYTLEVESARAHIWQETVMAMEVTGVRPILANLASELASKTQNQVILERSLKSKGPTFRTIELLWDPEYLEDVMTFNGLLSGTFWRGVKVTMSVITTMVVYSAGSYGWSDSVRDSQLKNRIYLAADEARPALIKPHSRDWERFLPNKFKPSGWERLKI